MTKTTHGIIHGRMIELAEDLGIAEGQQVEILIKVVRPSDNTSTRWGDGLRRCAGALASEWTAEDDRILEEIHQDRRRDIRPEIVE